MLETKPKTDNSSLHFQKAGFCGEKGVTQDLKAENLMCSPLYLHDVNVEVLQAGKENLTTLSTLEKDLIVKQHACDMASKEEDTSCISKGASPSVVEQHVIQMERLRRENENLRSQQLKLNAELNAVISASSQEKDALSQDMRFSVELCAILRLQNKWLMDFFAVPSIDFSPDMFDGAKCFSESTIRAEMEKISNELNISLNCYHGDILQNTSKCWISHLTESMRTAITKYKHTFHRSQMQLQQQLQRDMESLNTSMIQKMNRIVSSLSYLEQRQEAVSERVCSGIMFVNSHRLFQENQAQKCHSQLTTMKKENDELMQKCQQLQRENAALNKSLKVLKQRQVQAGAMSLLDSRYAVVVKEIQDAVSKIRPPPPHILKDESFLETIRLTTLRAEAQVDILSSLLHSLAHYVKKNYKGYSNPRVSERASLRMTSHQAEYYEKMKALLQDEKRKKVPLNGISETTLRSKSPDEGEEGSVCKALFSPFLSSTDDDALMSTHRHCVHDNQGNRHLEVDEEERVLAYIMEKGKIRDIVHNLRCYAQHLKNINALLENDSRREQKFTEDICSVLHGFEVSLPLFTTQMQKLINDSLEEQNS